MKTTEPKVSSRNSIKSSLAYLFSRNNKKKKNLSNDSLHNSENDPFIFFLFNSISPRKQYPPADLKKKTGLSTEHPSTSEWVAPICNSHPSTDNTQSRLINERCRPQTCLYPFHLNSKPLDATASPLLTLLPARPVTTITQQCPEDQERQKTRKR